MAGCKFCNTPIIWGITENGKKIPLDAKARTFFVFTDASNCVRREGHEPHFASCKSYRKGADSEKGGRKKPAGDTGKAVQSSLVPDRCRIRSISSV